MVPLKWTNLGVTLHTCLITLYDSSIIFYFIIIYFLGCVLIFMLGTPRWLQPSYKVSNDDIMPNINVSISNLGKSCQDYISIIGTLHLGVSKCCLLRLESCYHSSKYLSFIFMIICLVQLIDTSAVTDPCWRTSFLWNSSAHAEVHTCVEIIFVFGYRVHTSRSSLFDKFILHKFNIDTGKDT